MPLERGTVFALRAKSRSSSKNEMSVRSKRLPVIALSRLSLSHSSLSLLPEQNGNATMASRASCRDQGKTVRANLGVDISLRGSGNKPKWRQNGPFSCYSSTPINSRMKCKGSPISHTPRNEPPNQTATRVYAVSASRYELRTERLKLGTLLDTHGRAFDILDVPTAPSPSLTCFFDTPSPNRSHPSTQSICGVIYQSESMVLSQSRGTLVA